MAILNLSVNLKIQLMNLSHFNLAASFTDASCNTTTDSSNIPTDNSA